MPTESIPPATVVWFRRDLRLSDNPALEAAVARGGPVVAAWVHAPLEEGDSAPGAAARVFLHESLRLLAESLETRGSRLVLRRGPTIKALIDLARETGADAVYANKAWEPPLLARDAKAVAALRANGLDARLFDDDVLFPPDVMKTAAGGPFRVFTPFLRQCLSSPDPEAPRPAPARIPSPGTPPPSWPLPELRLRPSVPWGAGIDAAWPAGEEFDPGGDYVRTWVPELARMPKGWIHRPWEAPATVLSRARVTPGKTYPLPIVDHAAVRRRAIDALPAGWTLSLRKPAGTD